MKSSPEDSLFLTQGNAAEIRLTWSARHLHDSIRPVHTWRHAQSLLSLVGTTEWPWLTIRGDNRFVHCQGFADILTVEVAGSVLGSGVTQTWRVGRPQPGADWVFVDAAAGDELRVRNSQVLTLDEASVVLYDWLGTGRIVNFNLEEL